MFALLRMSSTPINTLIALRRVNTVSKPRAKRIAPMVKYEESSLGDMATL